MIHKNVRSLNQHDQNGLIFCSLAHHQGTENQGGTKGESNAVFHIDGLGFSEDKQGAKHRQGHNRIIKSCQGARVTLARSLVP